MARAIPALSGGTRTGGLASVIPGGRGRWPALVATLALGLVALLAATGQLAAARQALLGGSSSPTYQTATVTRGTISETVTATGPVAAAQTLAVTPRVTGTLAGIAVAVGQRVAQGAVLARFDTTELQASLDQARASLAQAEASYTKVAQGATAEERAAAQIALDNARRVAEDATKSAAASTASAQKDIDSAAASVESAATGLRTAGDNLIAAQAQMEAKLAADRLAVENAEMALAAAEAIVATQPAIQKEQLDAARSSLWAQQISRDATCGRGPGAACDSANASVAAAETGVNNVAAQAVQSQKQAEQTLLQARNAVATAKAALASDEVSLAASVKSAENAVRAAEAQLASARAAAAKSEAAVAASLQSAQASANSAQNQLRSAQASLAQTLAGPRITDVEGAAAQVASARVTVERAERDLAAATVVAPIAGTVAAITATVGQQVGASFLTLVTLDDLQVTAQVNEADVGKVSIGDPVSFTVSAFPGKTFTGAVTQIQPTGTTTSNVVTYAVTSSIRSLEGATLYPGMTATVTITTAERANVLVVPAAAVANGTARVLRDGQPVATRVTTGLADGARIEVVSGLAEGDVVVTGQTGGAAATPTTARATTQTTNPLTGGGPPAGFAPKP